MNLCLRLNAVAVLFLCYEHGTNGQQHLEIIVESKIKGYGQNLTLFCKIENCCQETAGWNIGISTLFLDINWIDPLKGFKNYPTYRATYDAKGIRLIIQNFSTSDLNKTHECVYGYNHASMTLLHNDVFSNNPSQDNDQENDVNKKLDFILLRIVIAVITVPIVVAAVACVISYILMRRRGKKSREFLPCCLKSSRNEYKNIDQTEMQPPLPNDAKQNQTEMQPPLPNDAKQNQTEMQSPLPNDAKQSKFSKRWIQVISKFIIEMNELNSGYNNPTRKDIITVDKN